MKFDKFGCLIRERYEDGHPANLGDSLAETSRHVIITSDFFRKLSQFWVIANGEVNLRRHPLTIWDDVSNDQILPYILACDLRGQSHGLENLWFVPNSKQLVNPAVWFASRKHYRMLNIANIVQGWLFNFKWRWSDSDEMKGRLLKFERSEGKVQEWLNYICVYIFLYNTSRWATLNQKYYRCTRAVNTYYLEGTDAEPNSHWLVDDFIVALRYIETLRRTATK